MKIDSGGNFDYCRWGEFSAQHNIRDIMPDVYFKQIMQTVRDEFSQGLMPSRCHPCAHMEQHGKVSGRQRQLLKIGVRLEQFEKTLASSPWVPILASKDFDQMPQDWQIDLGNHCNSACVFCVPESSSKLATEWKKIGFIKQVPRANWSGDPVLLERFIESLINSPKIKYIHFIGGEPVIMPAFRRILQALIDADLSHSVTIGFTTNLTVIDNEVIDILSKFETVNLGMSVESFDTVNDYVRWPIDHSTMWHNLQRWIQAANQHGWFKQIRITPTCLTVHRILPIYDFALANGINVESCNFLFKPEILKPSIIPQQYRSTIIANMQQWIDQHSDHSHTVVNTRNPHTVRAQLCQDLNSYVNYLRNEPDQSDRLPELVSWLKRIESSRENRIIDYLPEYAQLFESAGY